MSEELEKFLKETDSMRDGLTGTIDLPFTDKTEDHLDRLKNIIGDFIIRRCMCPYIHVHPVH